MGQTLALVNGADPVPCFCRSRGAGSRSWAWQGSVPPCSATWWQQGREDVVTHTPATHPALTPQGVLHLGLMQSNAGTLGCMSGIGSTQTLWQWNEGVSLAWLLA